MVRPRPSRIVKDITENLTRTEKFVLLTLSVYSDDKTGAAFPGEVRLAHDALMSERHLRRILYSLEAKGFITIEARRGGKKRADRTNLYTLSCVTAPKAPDI